MRTDADPDLVLIEAMLAPPPLAEARSSLEYWRTRRASLPVYRRQARREAAEMAARWQERVRAAQFAQFESGRAGRLLLALGVPRFWRQLPTLDRRVGRVAFAVGWRFVPPQAKVAFGAAAAFAVVVSVGVLAGLVLLLAQVV